MSKPPKRHTAIERYVFDKVSKVIAIIHSLPIKTIYLYIQQINKGLTDFYPKEDAKDLEGIEWKKKD